MDEEIDKKILTKRQILLYFVYFYFYFMRGRVMSVGSGTCVGAAFAELLAGRTGFFVVAPDGAVTQQQQWRAHPRLVFPGARHVSSLPVRWMAVH